MQDRRLPDRRKRNYWLHRRFAKVAERTRLYVHRTSKAQEYRDRAVDCRLQAERCSTEIEKEHWGKMAAEWLKMARDADIWGE
jgi:ribosomal protein L18